MSFDLAHFIVSCVFDRHDIPVPRLVFGILAFIPIILKQIHLYFKLEFKLGAVKLAIIGSTVTLPIAVRVRTASVAEQASYKKDALFDWRLRVFVSRSQDRSRPSDSPADSYRHLWDTQICPSSTPYSCRYSISRRDAGFWRNISLARERTPYFTHYQSRSRLNMASLSA
jgi:hypothetical protein